MSEMNRVPGRSAAEGVPGGRELGEATVEVMNLRDHLARAAEAAFKAAWNYGAEQLGLDQGMMKVSVTPSRVNAEIDTDTETGGWVSSELDGDEITWVSTNPDTLARTPINADFAAQRTGVSRDLLKLAEGPLRAAHHAARPLFEEARALWQSHSRLSSALQSAVADGVQVDVPADDQTAAEARERLDPNSAIALAVEARTRGTQTAARLLATHGLDVWRAGDRSQAMPGQLAWHLKGLGQHATEHAMRNRMTLGVPALAGAIESLAANPWDVGPERDAALARVDQLLREATFSETGEQVGLADLPVENRELLERVRVVADAVSEFAQMPAPEPTPEVPAAEPAPSDVADEAAAEETFAATPAQVQARWVATTAEVTTLLANGHVREVEGIIADLNQNIADHTASGIAPGAEETQWAYLDAVARAAIPVGEPPQISADEIARRLEGTRTLAPFDVEELERTTGVHALSAQFAQRHMAALPGDSPTPDPEHVRTALQGIADRSRPDPEGRDAGLMLASRPGADGVPSAFIWVDRSGTPQTHPTLPSAWIMENSQLMSMGNYAAGHLSDVWHWTDATGSVAQRARFSDGAMVDVAEVRGENGLWQKQSQQPLGQSLDRGMTPLMPMTPSTNLGQQGPTGP